jgi:hypothetical protein
MIVDIHVHVVSHIMDAQSLLVTGALRIIVNHALRRLGRFAVLNKRRNLQINPKVPFA